MPATSTNSQQLSRCYGLQRHVVLQAPFRPAFRQISFLKELRLDKSSTPKTSKTSAMTKAGIALAVGTFSVISTYSLFNLIPISTADKSILENAQDISPRFASIRQMNKAIDEIRHELSDTEDIISTEDEDLKAHGFSEWSSVNIDVLPVAVAYPRSTDQVSTMARICHKYKVPIIPYSGGSSLEGHTAAPFGGISIDFAFMDKILSFREADMNVTVQPGITWTDLNHELTKREGNYFFLIDPAPSAKIGGMIATNCSGTNAVRYGTVRDWVINLTVVLADGSVVKTRRRPRKCSAGYNLNGLIVGSEGTLAIVTEATLKLAAFPSYFSVAVIPFNSLKEAVSAAAAVIRKGVPFAALELMDEEQMRIVNEGGATRPRVWDETPTLFFKFSGTEGTVGDNIKTVKSIVTPHKSRAFNFATSKEEQESLWSARKESLYSLLALRKEGQFLWNTDVAVPLGALAELIEEIKAEAKKLGLQVCVKGHIGDGNFHENITYTPSNPEEAANTEVAVKNMVKRALEKDGTCTGEHGIGYGKKSALASEVGGDTLLLMKLLKKSLDPHWILNPGKIFDP
ncbi:hypothetical protein BU24DRAFT_474954 [Aaosphaeria arxii CBS 175.79]|uniref:D-lactate dehydrogenase (cytochrome) n=1 Tax=Aaosphaeria arxii CBS 175.79 TaxID=1450172 RepID=A0A6A5X7F6_9PLEO|nr:uncharacterized protein BU24DRAFT_474954 [Aaosphaeria arxii CBS 175.79]KAF2008878.1 hypothetical protein BU24DRAFT_474954 [Aaosphaeria arxii CBS 175.79]